ncbi:hypothetical protein M3Y99_01819800 [Aphelenchoides fujianensis]|nr:hypothetical protein M3Y99_01819800 [Aphelenchoides fujianensis]
MSDEEDAHDRSRSSSENEEGESANVGGGFTADQRLPIHKRWKPWAEFFCKKSSIVRYSPDGRYAYCLCGYGSDLLVVDLVRHCQLLLKSERKCFEVNVAEFVVVNATTIVALGGRGLWLLRLRVAAGSFEALQLADHEEWKRTYVLTEIAGSAVEVKRAVVHWQWVGTDLRFGRLNVDDARLEVEWEEDVANPTHSYQLSADGRSLFAVCPDELKTLRVYDLEKRTWSGREISGQIDRSFNSIEGGFWSPTHAYFLPFDYDQPSDRFVFRCNSTDAKWETLRIVADDIDLLSPLVDAQGEDEGLLLVVHEGRLGKRVVYRHFFKTVDSLERLAMDAFRKHHMKVKGDLNFHFFLNETTPGKRILPSLYANMKPFDRMP